MHTWISKERREEYYRSEYWQNFATSIRMRDKGCRFCGATDCVLEVHHISYKEGSGNYYAENPSNCVALCSDCHSRKVHGRDENGVKVRADLTRAEQLRHFGHPSDRDALLRKKIDAVLTTIDCRA